MPNPNPQNRFSKAVADLFPGYFALVMATGIISIACFFLEMRTLAVALLIINLFAYVVLWLLLFSRLVFFFSRIKADINDHVRGPGFFTVVAGTCVLGSQLLIVLDRYRIASALWVLGLILWVVIMYTFFTAMTVRENKPSIETGLNGGWLLVVVATQSISVLGTLLLGRYGDYREPILFFYPLHVFAWLHALFAAYHFDFLSLHVRQRHHRPAYATVLDQHGSCRDHHARGRAIDHRCLRLAAAE